MEIGRTYQEVQLRSPQSKENSETPDIEISQQVGLSDDYQLTRTLDIIRTHKDSIQKEY